VYPWAARLLGFDSAGRVVAHGMSAVLVALPAVFAALAARCPPAAAGEGAGAGGADARLAALLQPGGRLSLALDVAFVRPLFCPGKLALRLGEIAEIGGSAGGVALRVSFILSQADAPQAAQAAAKAHARGSVELRWAAVGGDDENCGAGGAGATGGSALLRARAGR
jgi:hypothetical protein